MNIFRESNNELGSVRVVYESPVKLESAAQKGFAHLLEHIVSEALVSVEDEYDQHGITSNAYTSGSEVVFYLTGLSDELDKYRDDFVRRITQYVPQQQHFEKQLPIVMQEYEDAFSNPHDAFTMSYWSQKYGAIGPIGARESLASASFQSICEAHRQLFAAPTKILVVGKTPMNTDYVQYAEPKTEVFNPALNEEPAADSLDSSVLVLAHSIPVDRPPTTFESSMLCAMFSMGLRSPLMMELREKRGLCYGLSLTPFSVGQKIGIAFETTVRRDKVQESIDVLRTVLADPQSLCETRFDTVKANRLIANRIVEQRGPNETIMYELERNASPYSLAKNLPGLTHERVLNYWSEHFLPGLSDWTTVSK